MGKQLKAFELERDKRTPDPDEAEAKVAEAEITMEEEGDEANEPDGESEISGWVEGKDIALVGNSETLCKQVALCLFFFCLSLLTQINSTTATNIVTKNTAHVHHIRAHWVSFTSDTSRYLHVHICL